MMRKARLSRLFSPKSVSNPIRLGRPNDGGYVVSADDVAKTEILVSLGIHDDWSFEKHFLDHKDCQVEMYDASVTWKFFIVKMWMSILTFWRLRNLYFSLTLFPRFYSFCAKNKVNHNAKFVGFDGEYSNISLGKVLKKTEGKKLFLKIDIEGSEYRILSELINFSDQICGLVIEFHSVDIHKDEIENFIEAIPLSVLNVSVNNACPIDLHGTPTVIEVTFTSTFCEVKESDRLLRELNQRNTLSLPAVELIFDD